jgi:uracil-DNA glycosylase
MLDTIIINMELEKLIENIHPSWQDFFYNSSEMLEEIINSIDWNDVVLPKKDSIFKVFEMDINEIKIVLLGQDPYHGLNQAMGLSFSVPNNVTIPPSLYNMFKEIKLEFPERNYNFTHGDISRWFYEEKIFLLNSALTVKLSSAGSHLDLWTTFTDQVIKYISEINDRCVFLLLGKYAQNKTKYIVSNCVNDRCVKGVHPSPLSANKGGFFKSNIFKDVEDKVGPINWNN